jgi:hypothetical protein
MPRDEDETELMSVAELASARRVEAAAARKLAKNLVELAQILESEKAPDFNEMQGGETDVAFCYRVYRTAMLHRRAVYDA